MKAISFKPAGTAISFRIAEIFSKFLSNFGLHLAAICAGICVFSAALELDVMSGIAAFVAMIGIYPQFKFEKGE